MEKSSRRDSDCIPAFLINGTNGHGGKQNKGGQDQLTIDSDIRTGREGGDVEVTPTGDNTDRYYVDSWEVTNDNGDTWTRSNPPEIDIVLGVEDEEEYYLQALRPAASS